MSINQNRSRATVRPVLDALLVAIYFLLSSVLTVKTATLEISWSSFPILLAGFLLGLPDALAVATLGSFFEQMAYGLNGQAWIWMLPVIILGAASGLFGILYRKKKHLFVLLPSILLCEILLTVANTYALQACGWILAGVDSALLLIWGYVTRLPVALIRAALSMIALPLLLPILEKLLWKKGYRK